MSTVFPLGRHYPSAADVEPLIDAAPRCASLREAVEQAIRTIHGLPQVLEADSLRQVEIYWGRAGATAQHVIQRWKARADMWNHPPSAVALVALRGRTRQVRREHWEAAGNRIIRALERRGALCVSNMRGGQGGPWPESTETVLYLVGRLRRGPVGGPPAEADVNAAIVELLGEESLPDEAARKVILVAHPEQAEDHELLEMDEWEDEEDEEDHTNVAPDPLCRKAGCNYRARPGNYGFCLRHRT